MVMVKIKKQKKQLYEEKKNSNIRHLPIFSDTTKTFLPFHREEQNVAKKV
jgi:hypothetical protein